MSKRIVILGAGESGVGAAVLAKVEGFDVFVSDLSPIQDKYKEMLEQYQIPWEEGKHTPKRILDADEVIKSPGIPDKAPMIKSLVEKGIPIISEIEFAGRYTNAKMICITGSNGKTTTTLLTYHILKNAGLNVGLAGNIGHSLAYQVATQSYDYYVIELSSFQLDNMYNFKADIAILLNITPDHLDRYGYQMSNYIRAKFRITQNQTSEDAFIFWKEDPIISQYLSEHPISSSCYPFAENGENLASFLEKDQLVIKPTNEGFSMSQSELSLTGKHNLYNSMAAGISAHLLQIKNKQIKEALSSFEGVEHRLEKVATVRGVTYVNDSKATNVNSCWYALQSMKTPTVLILGGTDKGNDYTEIEPLVQEKVHTLICMGIENGKLLSFFTGKVPTILEASSMQQAIELAYNHAHTGDTVLLSPCCASFDLFKNYEDRGQQFKFAVRAL